MLMLDDIVNGKINFLCSCCSLVFGQRSHFQFAGDSRRRTAQEQNHGSDAIERRGISAYKSNPKRQQLTRS